MFSRVRRSLLLSPPPPPSSQRHGDRHDNHTPSHRGKDGRTTSNGTSFETTMMTATMTASAMEEEAHLLLEELRTVVTRLEDLSRRVRLAASRADEKEKDNEGDLPPPPNKKDEARFLRLNERDEGDAVEWLRRIAELVVLSERKAGRWLRRSSRQSRQRHGRDDGVGRNGTENGNRNKDIPSDDEGSIGTPPHDQEELALPYLSLFEFFCEKNVLALVVNMVTGAAFADTLTNHASNNTSSSVRLLPPLSIATQSIQSVSILIQNVSRPTTLYYLLSNNRVNDLIDLPLDLYHRAAGREGLEAGELTTHFVSFLKSLAMRVNRETLQFFLSFPVGDGKKVGEGTAEKELVEVGAVDRVNEEDTDGMVDGMIDADVEMDGGEDDATSPEEGEETDVKKVEEGKEEVGDGAVDRMNDATSPEEGKETNISNTEEGERNDDEKELGDANGVDGERKDAEPSSEEALKGKLDSDASGTADEPTSPIKEEHGDERDRDTLPETPRQPPPSTSTKSTLTRQPYRPIDAAKRPLTHLRKQRIVEFPLYARALEFCASEQDSFVRVTAMNVCMNLVRLAARCKEDDVVERERDNRRDADSDHNDNNHDHDHNHRDIDSNHNHDNSTDTENHDNSTYFDHSDDGLPTETPSGTLHEAPSLPLRDRIAIVQYACHPRRVYDLVSPLCARLTTQFGQVEGTVRALQDLGRTNDSLETRNRPPPKMKDADASSKRRKLRETMDDLAANVQDELLLLDDLLRVGVVSLNEQAIELVLATFVYPMLLQPLLLPLHRFSSSTSSSKEPASHPPSNASSPPPTKEPVIALQSPEPFAPHSKQILPSSSDNDNDQVNVDDHADESPSPSHSSPRRSDLPRHHSSHNMDLAPSKTALFGLCIVLDTVTDPSLRRLLLTASWHPLSPPATGGPIVRVAPRAAVPRREMGRGSEDVRWEIRLARRRGDTERDDEQKESLEGIDVGGSLYGFGTDFPIDHVPESSDLDVEDVTDDDRCVFVLAPGLVEILRGGTGTVPSPDDARENPYRKILMAAVSGSEEMASLQSLATRALHAAVSSGRDVPIVRRILFASRSRERESSGEGRVPSHPKEVELNRMLFDASETKDGRTNTLESLCRGVLNKSVTYDGWWKVRFDKVAAKTLVDILSDDPDLIRAADSIVSDVRMEAANFLVGLPALLDSTSKSKADDANSISSTSKPKSNPVDHQHIDAWLLDRFFFDQPDKSSISVVENLCYLKEEDPDGDESKMQYRYGLEVLGSASLSDASAVLCEDSLLIDNMVVSTAAKDTPFVCAASWALVCLTLDAFSTRLSKMIPDSDSIEGTSSSKKKIWMKRLSYVSEDSDGDNSEGGATSYSLAHVSSKFSIAMLDEGESSSKKGDVQPTHGSRVNLIGKTCFPCVCEVSRQFAHLFTGRTCVSNEGVQWQSLYLVFVGRWIVLAEPDRESSGGEGRVITSCRLACLAIKKDTTLINNATPARRLLVAHSSLDPRLPALFVLDAGSSRRSSSPNLGSSGLRLTRSRMDLWFEDSNAAGRAWKVLAGKIAKARARRGARLRAALLAPR